jgi:NADH dehydrogenase (ubiquinone) Fe-S protein 1
MVSVYVNDIKIEIPLNSTVLQACDVAGVNIPRFCYHNRLLVAGNCRMCLVEIENSPKPVVSCALPVMKDMKIYTDTPLVKKAKEAVLEFLLLNHPLDCPICDQGGECDLQDQSVHFGSDSSRFYEYKRSVEDKNCGPLIKTIMTRCIHCTRCVRFSTEIAGVPDLGTLGRGTKTEIGTFIQKVLSSEVSGNVIDLCPVGALTSKPYAFKARSWELKSTNSIDVFDSLGSNVVLNSKGLDIVRVLPRVNDNINEEWISDKVRFSFDGFSNQRLVSPMVKGEDGFFYNINWERSFDLLKNLISPSNSKKTKIGGVFGNFIDVESALVIKDFFNKVGSSSLFTEKSNLSNNDFTSNFTFNSGLSNIENSDVCLVVGSNPRYDASMLNLRLRKKVRAGSMRVGYFGPSMDTTYETSHLGLDKKSFFNFLGGNHPFSKVFKNAKNPSVILFDNFLDNSEINVVKSILKENTPVFKEDWCGFNVLLENASSYSLNNLGFQGFNASKLNSLDVLFLFGSEKIDIPSSFNGKVVYVGSHGDKNVNNADLILPSSIFSEKRSSFFNTEGRLQTAFKSPNGLEKNYSEWKIFRAFAEYIGIDLGYSSSDDVQEHFNNEFGFFSNKDSLNNNIFEFGNPTSYSLIGSNDVCKVNIGDFYRSDVITRNSKIMLKCSNLRVKTNFL